MTIFRTLLLTISLCVMPVIPVPGQGTDDWAKAEQNGEQARKALLHCRQFVYAWLDHADPTTGLIPRNLSKDAFWNARDSAADNYPFMVLTAALTDRPLFEGRMKDILRTEIRLTSRVGALPDDFLFTTQAFRTPEVDMKQVIFGASEYVKDGLLPLTEWLGPSPWFDRLISLLDGMLEHAAIETEVGMLPANDHEVCGNLMQSLSRAYWWTKDDKYREWAFRVADYFLVHHSPIQAEKLRLDDHGCEVIGGLSEVYFLAAQTDPERRNRYREPMHAILDRVLEVGANADGLLYETVNPVSGEILSQAFTDNWGYNYNAFLTVAELDNAQKYCDAVRHVLQNILKNLDYRWENGIADGYADSIEGGLNLLNRVPVEDGFQWVDASTEIMLNLQKDYGIVAGWHGDGNYARTAIMYALWKTQGLSVEPWRGDLVFGAVPGENGSLRIYMRAEWPWKGKLKFDIPRHKEYLHLPFDYPRLNQFPEWFTVEKDKEYQLSVDGQGSTLTGEQMHQGAEIELKKDTGVRIVVTVR